MKSTSKVTRLRVSNSWTRDGTLGHGMGVRGIGLSVLCIRSDKINGRFGRLVTYVRRVHQYIKQALLAVAQSRT